jgi:phosphatidylinositol glycan class B
VLMIGAYFSEGFYHFDEHFQILEFANYKLGNISADKLTWEFREQMRPTLQPSMVVGITKTFNLFGWDNPFHIATYLRFLSAFMGWLTLVLTYAWGRNKFKTSFEKKWFLRTSFFLWFLLFNCVRFSSENWSGIWFFIGVAIFALQTKSSAKTLFFVGICFGLSFLFRYQSGFLIVGWVIWFLIVYKTNLKSFLVFSFGLAVIIVLGSLLDIWFYGEFTFAPWNYLNQNLIIGKASGFGIEPFWWYFTEGMVKMIPPFSLIFLLGLILFGWKNWKSPIIWSIIPFILVHSIIGHKEIRFLFPILFLFPLFFVKGLSAIQNSFEQWKARKFSTIITKTFWVFNLLALVIVLVLPAEPHIDLYRKLYNEYEKPITLYYYKENPYDRVADIQWYKRPTLEIQKAPSDSALKITEIHLFTHLTKENISNPKGELIYQSLPSWILNYNFNNWQSRSRIWKVYEVENINN